MTDAAASAIPPGRPGAAGRTAPTAGWRRSDGWSEPGVHLPFLAPTLSGVRLRSTAHGPEFVLPNPSGGRGVYIASWAVVTGFAAPVPHDTLLVGRLAGLDRIGPAEVREAARGVALEGFAGADAAEAARDAQRAAEEAVARLRAQFVRSAARIAGFGPEVPASRLIERGGFAELSRRLNWRPPELAAAMEALSLRCASVLTGTVGRTTAAADGRWSRMRSLLRRLRQSMSGTLYGRNDVDAMLLGRVVAAADHCLRTCDALLPRIEALLADPLAELEACRKGDAATVLAWLDEMETVLDGWDRIGLLWFDAADGRGRRELIPEIAALARTGGGDGWSGTAVRPDHPGEDANNNRHDRLRTRNERIRAMELAFEARNDQDSHDRDIHDRHTRDRRGSEAATAA